MIIVFYIFIFAGLIVRNVHLSSVLFSDWDEGMYAQIAEEILKNKSIFTTFNHQIWLDKPPLLHSLIAFSFSIFGRSEFYARMIAVVFAVALLVLLYFLSKKIMRQLFRYDIPIAHLIPVLIVAGSPIYLERATMLNTDIIIAVSWLGFFLYQDKLIYKAIFLIIGVWSKSVLGFYPLIVEFVSRLFTHFLGFKNKNTVNKTSPDKFNVIKYLTVLTVASFWYILGILKYGKYFIDVHFADQVLKRVYTPIELHFGNKYYYFQYLIDQLGFVNLFFICGYLLILFDFFNRLRKKGLGIVNSTAWASFIVLFAPVPFLLFLSIGKTKIYWYVIIFFPLIALTLSYLYLRIQNSIIRSIFTILALLYFSVNFMNQTFLMKINYSVPDRIRLAQCLNKMPGDNVAFLVDDDERKIKNVLEAAHYQTQSSFYYGGSPSFVFYLNKKMDYFYNIEDFITKKSQYPLIAYSVKDQNKLMIKTKPVCQYGDWLGYINVKTQIK